MLLKQFYLGCLAQASYLIGDRDHGAAVVVDPRRDIDEYVDEAERLGLRIERVILTHFHADFVAGHIELRDRVGARICLGAGAQADYPFDPLHDGDVITLGRVRLEILATPGHTPEAICILVRDLGAPEEPGALLTGDTLFIGDVGRPDLMASPGTSAVDLAGQLYDSLHGKLLSLSDETIVYPGHGAGSLCGKNMSSETSSPLGVQRRYNYALQPMSKEAFVDLVTADQPEAPAYFAYDADFNRRERIRLDEVLPAELRPHALGAVLQAQQDGAQIIDVRDPGEFAAAHLAGAINIGLGGQYASWAGTLLDRARPIVLICEPDAEVEAATRMGRVGIENIAGYLAGGMASVRERPDLLRSFRRYAPRTLRERLQDADDPYLLDVRREGETRLGRIAGSANVPLGQLEQRIEEVPRDREVTIYCAGGYRSAIAAGILQAHGFTQLSDLAGGYNAWVASGCPAEAPPERSQSPSV